MSSNCCLEESLSRYIGQTVTIFTTSGGLSGSGFTGVLAFVGNGCIKLITSIGAAPSCAVGSTCTGWSNWGRKYDHEKCHNSCKKYNNSYYNGYYNGSYGGWNNNDYYEKGYNKCHEKNEMEYDYCGDNYNGNWLGSVTEIPIDRIASFSHNAI